VTPPARWFGEAPCHLDVFRLPVHCLAYILHGLWYSSESTSHSTRRRKSVHPFLFFYNCANSSRWLPTSPAGQECCDVAERNLHWCFPITGGGVPFSSSSSSLSPPPPSPPPATEAAAAARRRAPPHPRGRAICAAVEEVLRSPARFGLDPRRPFDLVTVTPPYEEVPTPPPTTATYHPPSSHLPSHPHPPSITPTITQHPPSHPPSHLPLHLRSHPPSHLPSHPRPTPVTRSPHYHTLHTHTLPSTAHDP